jgi:membrane protease YdiL (CAAX protease family)
MEMANVLLLVLALGYCLLAMYLANVSVATGRTHRLLHPLLYGSLVGVFFVALTVVQAAFLPAAAGLMEAAEGEALPVVSTGDALLAFALACAVLAGGHLVLRVPQVTERIGRTLGQAAFRPDSAVHQTALILIGMAVSLNFTLFVLGGGLAGLAAALEGQSYTLQDIALNQLLWVVAAVLGIGLFIRRDGRSAVARLGLRWPTGRDWLEGVLGGLLCYALIFVFGIVYTLIATPEQIAAQSAAAEGVVSAFDSLAVALVGTALVAFGEELFFRGAVQPVFGIAFTSVFFTVMHTQYLLTPAAAALLLVSVVFGLLRKRQSTTAAIIAHFVYNFVQLALALLASSVLSAP